MSAPLRDVGLGTAYERLAIYRALDRWLPSPPRTAIEGPIDGMAGMPGLHLLGLARRGTRVTVVHEDDAALERVRAVYERAGLGSLLEVARRTPDRRFELALLFNVAVAPAWSEALDECVRLAERAAIFVTHPSSWGAWARRALRRLERAGQPELFDHPACRPSVLEPALRARGEIERRAFVDCPWWPDLFVAPGETLASATAARLGRRARRDGRTAYDYGPHDFPYCRVPLPRELARALARHPGFDGWPAPVASVFAHHRGYLLKT